MQVPDFPNNKQARLFSYQVIAETNGMDRMARCDEESSLQSLQPVHPGQSTHTAVTSTSPVTPILATCIATATDKVTATTTSSTHVPDAGSAGSPSK